MRFLHLVAVTASLASALVIPDEQVLASLELEKSRDYDDDNGSDLFHHATDVFHSYWESVADTVQDFRHALDDALEVAAAEKQQYEDGFVDDNIPEYGYNIMAGINNNDGDHDKDRPHHGQSDLTIYELISRSKYTTKLAKLIDLDEELVQLLNGTQANYTVFAPTDDAFAKIPENHPKPSKELLRNVLLYHITPDVYSAGQVFHTHTLPTLYNETGLGKDLPQRIAIRKGWRGLTVNFYARIVAVNIGASNGVIHGINSLLIPPPPPLTILDFMPGEFSTLTLALTKTSLLPLLNTSLTPHQGSTFFAPTNTAFRALGPRVNAFLFSTKEGQKHLRALLKYHIVHNQTLYSDVLYTSAGKIEPLFPPDMPPQQRAHVDLPTLLQLSDGSTLNLAIDVARWGPFITLRVNGFQSVAVSDGVTRDGSMHVVNRVLVPPRKLNSVNEVFNDDEGLNVEEFKERMRPYVDGSDESDDAAFASVFDQVEW